MKERKYSVYIHKFPNGKVYVGLTKQTLDQRWGKNGNGYKGQLVYDAILEYGWDNVEHEVFTGLTKEEAKQKECELISKYDSINNGYNIAKGGGCGGEPWNTYQYKGKEYTAEELAMMSPFDNISSHSISNRIRRGKNIEEAINTPAIERKRLIEYNEEYYTAKELAQLSTIEGLTAKNIKYRLQHGWTVERAITQPLDVKLQPFGITGNKFEYNGQLLSVYELWLLRKCPELTEQTISHRLNGKGWDVERAITQPPKQYNVVYEYQGKSVTVEDIIKLNPELKNHDVTDRLRAGWSIEKIINTPLEHKKKYLYNDQWMSLQQIYNLTEQHKYAYSTFSQKVKHGMPIEEAL